MWEHEITLESDNGDQIGGDYANWGDPHGAQGGSGLGETVRGGEDGAGLAFSLHNR